MKIYNSTEHIKEPKIGDLRLKVNSMWDFSSRSVCFRDIKKTIGNGTESISYDLFECIDVKDGIIVGGTKKVKSTKWKQADMTLDIVNQLKEDGYIVSNIKL